MASLRAVNGFLARFESGQLTVAAIAIAAATLIPFALGDAFDIFVLQVWGGISVYTGVSSVVPGVLIGVATRRRLRGLGQRYSRLAGIVAGTATFVLLFAASLFAVAALPDDTGTKARTGGGAPSTPSLTDRERAVAAVQAAVQRTGDARATHIVCGKTGLAISCVVTFSGPACQPWIVSTNDGDYKAVPVGDPIMGLRGSYDPAHARASCRA